MVTTYIEGSQSYEHESKTKSKTIDTPFLAVQGNVMTWDNVMIQISNISLLSAIPITPSEFPFWALIAVIAGLFLFNVSALLALVLIAIGAVEIYSWYTESEKRKQGAILTIQ